MIRLLLAVGLFLCANTLLISTSLATEVVKRVFTAKDGLANTDIQDILSDQSAYVWLATEEGLYRVSNNVVRRVDKEGSESVLRDEILTKLFRVDQDHLLVVSYASVYLYNIPRNQFTFLNRPLLDGTYTEDGLSIASIFAKKNGDILAMTWSGQLYLFDKAQQKFIYQDVQKLDPQAMWKSAIELNNGYYLFASATQIALHDTKGQMIASFPLNNSHGKIKQLYQDRNDRVWLVTSNGLFRLKLDALSLTPVDKVPFNINAINQDSTGALLVGGRSGLFRWSPESDELISYRDTLKQAANIDFAIDIEIDKNGLVWVGGSGDSVAILGFKADFITDVFSKLSRYKLENELIWTIYQEGNQVWLGTDEGVIVANTDTGTSTKIIPNGLEVNDSVYHVISLDDEHVVLSTTNGLFVVNKHTYETSSFKDWSNSDGALVNKVVLSSYRDPLHPQRIWFSSNVGLHYWEPGNASLVSVNLRKHRTDEGELWINSVFRDSEQRLWLAGDRVFGYLDDELAFHPVDVLKQFNAFISANSVIEFSKDVLWVGTKQNGLLEFNVATNQIHSLDKKWQLDCKSIYFLRNTPTSILVGCSDAIIQIDRLTQKVQLYSNYDGFISTELNDGAAFYSEEKGLYVGTPDGAMLINPEKLTHKNNVEMLFLESLQVYYDDSIEKYLVPLPGSIIKPGASFISFQVATSNYLDINPIQLQYRLVNRLNVAANYLSLEGQSQINIAGLSAGSYTLQLKYKRHGVWSVDPYEFSFEVQQHWWQSQQFKGVVIIAVLLGSVALILGRQRQVNLFKNVNSALVESDNQLRKALKGSESDLWEWRAQTNSLYIENRGGILGELPRLKVHVTNMPIHKDDISRVNVAWQALLKAEVDRIEVEYRYWHPANEWRWYRIRGKAIQFDINTGRLLHVSGMYADITQQRALESEINLLAEAFENTSEGMLILNADMSIKINNSAACSILIAKENELIEKAFSSLVYGSHVSQDYSYALSQTGSWQGECEFIRLDSEYCPVWVNISAMNHSLDTVKHYVVIFSDISERKQSESNLRYLANNDSLTGLTNRAKFVSALSEVIDHATITDEKLALLFLDLDRFKHVNDSYGHSMGDALLIEASHRLQSCLTSDDLLCRFGGDEFVILLRNASDVDKINALANKLLVQLETPFKLHGREFYISTSIGISSWPEDGELPEVLIKNADLAMYHAKEEGRGIFRYYSAERNEEALYHLRLETDLRRAIEHNEFELHYQPQIDILHNDKFIGMEALIRWKHPTEGNIRPDIFIKIAESCGLIVDIDRWVLRQACLDGARLRKLYNNLFKLSVNISAVHFRQIDFIEHLKAELNSTGFPASQLCVEITEGVLMKELHLANQHLVELKKLGVQVAIDDFGTGYSSLAYLRTFEVNILKIDRSFLIHIANNTADQAIVSSIIELARNLKLTVVAEGVETHAQLEQVFSRGCYIIQGYYFSKPMPRDQLDQYLGLISIDEKQA